MNNIELRLIIKTWRFSQKRDVRFIENLKKKYSGLCFRGTGFGTGGDLWQGFIINKIILTISGNANELVSALNELVNEFNHITVKSLV